jgi:hypothetical protein
MIEADDVLLNGLLWNGSWEEALTHEPQEEEQARAILRTFSTEWEEQRRTLNPTHNMMHVLTAPIGHGGDAFGWCLTLRLIEQARQRYDALLEELEEVDRTSPVVLVESCIGFLRRAACEKTVPEVTLRDYLLVVANKRVGRALKKKFEKAKRRESLWLANLPPDEPLGPEDQARREAFAARFRRRVRVTRWAVICPSRTSKTGWSMRIGGFGFKSEAEALACADQERERAAGRWPIEVVAEEAWVNPEDVNDEDGSDKDDAVAPDPLPPEDL